MMIRKFSILFSCIVFMVLFVISMCSFSRQLNNSTFKNPSYGDCLIIGTTTEPGPINPMLTISGISAMLSDLLFDGLITIDDQGNVCPHLADSWEANDQYSEWIFHLLYVSSTLTDR